MDIADRLHKEAMNVPIEIGALMQDAADQLMRLHVQLEIAYDRLYGYSGVLTVFTG